MSRMNATDRMRRLLAVIPWVSGRGEVPLAEIAERFDYPIARLRRDLTEVVQFVGVFPYTPDMLIEVFLDDENERVRFELADYFTAPLRLTPDEGLALVSAGLGLLDSAVGDNRILERGLGKVADRFGLALGEEIVVTLGGAAPEVIEQARAAVADRHCLEIEYHSLHRGQNTVRVVEPLQVYSRDGEWYLRAFCRLAEAERTFRLDRVLAIETLADGFDREPGDLTATFAPGEDDLRVTLRLGSAARWVAEAYPIEGLVEVDGGIEVTLAVSSLVWLERLLLRLGPAAEVVASVPELPDDLVRGAAERVLARYR